MLKLGRENRKYTCQYCKYWIQSKVIRREVKEENENNKKKKSKLVKRKCPTKSKKAKPIETTSPACKYFSPESFWCDHFDCWLTIPQCIARRRNTLKLEVWDRCKKCRQFELEIREIVNDYWINGKAIKEPGEPKKKTQRKWKRDKKIIKRRVKPKKIKRRVVKKKVRKIKRR